MTEETIFQEALARSDVDRARFLDQACSGQPQLRAAVEALLAAHQKPDNLLDNLPGNLAATVVSQPAGADLAATGEHTPNAFGSQDAKVPSTLTTDYRRDAVVGVVIGGRYTLQEKIGEGGMGEVWVAKQTEPVKRKVALKLIKTGMDSRAVLQRFEQERQALALMDHPHIARVLDGGMTPTGQPFFVMELVNGLSLTKFCDELKLSLKERLELFVPICQAVQHAHQKGIVHRDLKPANILVTMIDGKPVPKVIDFGVAKATSGKLTEETMSTGFGAVVGTLEYMSPEQAGFSGEDIDTRADIYSLGVILYELLTGLRPIDAKRLRKAALTEMIRIIREEEPSKPSTRLSTDESLPSVAAVRQVEPRKLTALLRGELDWVVMKCLEKHRERRYETANGLARDIQRYLADEAVEARPPSAGYRLQKFVRRNKGQVIAASLVLFALIGGSIAVAAVQHSANLRLAEANALIAEQRDEANRQRVFATEAQVKAEQSEATAREQALLALKNIQFIVTDVDDRLAKQPGMSQLRVDLLKVVEKKWDELDIALTGGIKGQAIPTLMAVRAKIADAWLNLDKLQEADAQYESIYQQAQQRVIDKNRNDASRLNLALISVKWGAVRQRLTADPAEGEKYRSEATALLRDIIQNPNPELLPGTNKPDPNSPAMHQVTDALQQSLLYSASVATKSGKLDEAFNLYKEIEQVNQTVVNEIDKAAQWYQAMPEDRKLAVANYFKQNVDLSKSGQANLLVRQGKTEQAVPIYELVIEKRLKNYEEQPNDFSVRDQLALQYRNYAQNMLRANRAEDAIRLMEKAHDLTEKNYQEDPTNAKYKKSHGYSLYYWGVARDAVGQKPDALALFERSRALRQEMFDASPDHSNKVDLMLSEGRIGNTESCLKLVRELSAIEAKNPDLRLDLARALAQLARSKDEAAEKEALLNQAFAALSKAVGDGLTDPFAVTSEMDLVPLRADERLIQTLATIRK